MFEFAIQVIIVSGLCAFAGTGIGLIIKRYRNGYDG